MSKNSCLFFFFIFLRQASLLTILISTFIISSSSSAHVSATPSHRLNTSNPLQLHLAETLLIPGAVGPESFAFDPLGRGPYTGVSDGRIVKWDESQQGWIDFATVSPSPRDACEEVGDKELMEETCGRPLGLEFFHKTGDLYIADAYMGLLVVGPGGGVASKVLTEADGVPFGFTNGLGIDQEGGVVYFTDSSTRYQRRNHISVILSGDDSGRLIKYELGTKQTTVLLDKLVFPNGVALSENGDFILVAETTKCRILRYWLKTERAATVDVFSGNLEGFPDNVKRNDKGEFWVGIHSKRTLFVGLATRYPKLGNAVLKMMPFDPMRLISMTARWRGGGFAVKLNQEGLVLGTLDGKNGGSRWSSISEVADRDGHLWIGSVTMPFAGVLDPPQNWHVSSEIQHRFADELYVVSSSAGSCIIRQTSVTVCVPYKRPCILRNCPHEGQLYIYCTHFITI